MISAARKTAELAGYLASVESELQWWREAADGDKKPLWRHHTQIEAVAGALDELARLVGEDLSGAEGDWIFESAPYVERRVLDLHRLWGFFRDKLALRYVPAFADALLVADDLAWACYEPAQRFIAAGARREPPLLYFSGGSTPHLMPRGTPYAVAPLPDGGVSPPKFTELVDGMPIALVGLPWFEVDHVPDLPVIAHEVGHAVERDLGLEPSLEALITGAVAAEHAEAWGGWRPEVFADLYGVLALGPGYAATLAGLLAGHPRDVEGEWRPPGRWGDYPTRTLRVLLAAQVLRVRGFAEAADELASGWRTAYPTHHHADFVDDVEPVVAALLTGGLEALGGEPVGAIIAFGTAEQEEADAAAARLRSRMAPSTTERIRPLVAGARLAYERPAKRYDPGRASSSVRQRAKAIQTFGRRTAAGAPEAAPADVRAERDQRAGRALYDLLTQDDHRGGADVQAQQT